MKLIEVEKKILESIWEEGPLELRRISEKTGLSVRLANIRLQNLKRAGFVSATGGRYIVTEKGREAIGFPTMDGEMAEKILSKVPHEKAFQFYTGWDQSLGVSSDSLTDLCEKIRSVNLKSIEFHIYRGDFESWVNFLQDVELVKRLNLIREAKLTGEELREKLYATVKARCDELQKN